jgi:hypothetical protein
VRSFIQGPNTGGAEHLTYEGCSEIEPEGCTIKEEIITAPVVMTFETGPKEPEARVRLAPKTGHELAELEFKGSCSLAGVKPINGVLILGLPLAGTELTTQPLVPLGTTENNSLELAGQKGYLAKGKILRKIINELTFSFHR